MVDNEKKKKIGTSFLTTVPSDRVTVEIKQLKKTNKNNHIATGTHT